MTTLAAPPDSVYQPGPINRARRTKAQVEQLEGQIYEVLEEDHPLSVRHIFYRMTDPRLPEPVAKTDNGSPNGYKQVQNRLTLMRRAGTIPYGWITDATRRGYHTNTYSNAADFLRRHQAAYRADLWASAGVYVEVWCESRSIAGMIEDTCRDLAVSLYPAGGFTSLTLAYQAAEYINHATSEGEIPAHVIYLGDYDPAGVLIDQKVSEELRRHLNPDIDLGFHRIAVTAEQIVSMDLPTKPRKKGERRVQHIRETVECEAIPARVLRTLLRDTIEEYLPTGAIEAARIAEESEREMIGWAADTLAVL